MFHKDKSAKNKRMPDYAYIRKELLRTMHYLREG